MPIVKEFSVIKSTVDDRDLYLNNSVHLEPINKFPLSVFLRPSNPVCVHAEYKDHELQLAYKQYGLYSSASHVGCSALELAYHRSPLDALPAIIDRSVKFSRFYLYNEIIKMKKNKHDSRCSPRDICKALIKKGVCLEKNFNYRQTDGYSIEPNLLASGIAETFTIFEYKRIKEDLNTVNHIRNCLYKGIPVLAMIMVDISLLKVNKDWRIANEGERDCKDPLGYHMVLITGYDDTLCRFHVENNYGKDWGDNGCFGLAYDHVLNVNKQFEHEYWILSELQIDYVPDLTPPRGQIFLADPGPGDEDVVHSIYDERDLLQVPELLVSQALKDKTALTTVDMRPWAREVEQQGSLGACTANAACSALELAYSRAGLEHNFSRLYLYYYIREYQAKKQQSTGGIPRNMGKALLRHGVCLESTWPYHEAQVNKEPPERAKLQAHNYKINEYRNIPLVNNADVDNSDTVDMIRLSLSNGIPVLVTFWTHQDFYIQLFTQHAAMCKTPWQTHSWNSETSPDNPRSRPHESLIIGYDDDSRRFLVENSWGTWYCGDGGFFGLPYDKISRECAFEFWVLSDIGIPYLPFDEPLDEPILNKVYFPPVEFSELDEPALFEGESTVCLTITAERSLTTRGNKKTNILNMFNKPQPKGLGLAVTIDLDTLECEAINSEQGRYFITHHDTKGPAVIVEDCRPGDSLIIHFDSKEEDPHRLVLSFVPHGRKQQVVIEKEDHVAMVVK